MSGFSVGVKGDLKAITKDLDQVQKKIVPQVSSSALNKAATKVRSVSTKHVAKAKQITPQKLIRERMAIKRSNKRTQRTKIIALLNGIPVDKLTARTKSKHMPSGGFVMQVRGGKELIVTRKQKSKQAAGRDRKGRPRRGRLPVERTKVRIETTVNITVRRVIRTTGASHFKKTFERDLNYRLQKKGLI
jgi:hypothetical protein